MNESLGKSLGDNKEEKKRRFSWLLLLYPLALIIWLFGWKFGPSIFGAASGVSDLGDVFGAVNALFTALAFAGLIHTVIMQREELELQRKELRDTRKVFEKQKEQMELQNETLRRQQFEATFFQMLRMFDEHRRTIKAGGLEGLAAVRNLKSSAEYKLREMGQGSFHILMREQLYEEHLGPYLRQYVNLCSFVEAGQFEDKQTYWHLLRDLLTSPEAVLIIFYCNSSTQYSAMLKAIAESHGLMYNATTDINWTLEKQNGWDAKAFQAF